MIRVAFALLFAVQTACAMFPVALFQPLDNNTVDWANRVRVQGSDVTIGTLGAADRYTVGLRLDGVWTKFARHSLYVGTTIDALKAPLLNKVGFAADVINNFAATNWSQNRGLGSTSTNDNKYIATGINLSTGFFTTNDIHMAAYVRAGANDERQVLLGSQIPSVSATLLQASAVGTSAWYANDVATQGATKYDGGAFGLHVGSRTATNFSVIYKDAAPLATNTVTGTAFPTVTNLFVHAVNNNGSADGWTVQTLEMYSIGLGLTATDVARYTNRYGILRGELGRALPGDPNVNDWVARLQRENTDVSSSDKSAMDTYVTGLKSDGIWDELIRHNIYCGTNFTAVKVPLKIYAGPNTDTLTAFLSTDWTNTVGLTGDGSTKFIDAAVNVNDSLMGDNDIHLATYVRVGSGETKITMGAQQTGVGETTLYISYGGVNTTWACNQPTTTYAAFADAAGTGLYVGSRTASNFSVIYKGGSPQATNTVAGGARGARRIYVHGFNNNGALLQPTTRTLEGYSFGTGLTATQATNYHTRYSTLRTAIGR